MIHVQKIFLNRAEGPRGQTGRATADSFREANQILRTAATTAPQPGHGYNKVDFKVVWEDREEYKGRYDLTYDDTVRANIGEHIRDFLRLMGGTRRPNHFSKEDYEIFLENQEYMTKVPRQSYLDFMKGRELD